MSAYSGLAMMTEGPQKRQSSFAVEGPTLALILAVYSAWLALTYWSATLPLAVTLILGPILLAAHSSLQHEILHGHPTSSRAINRALAFPPLSLWLPYELYRRSHLIHHRDERLTDPLDDPESWYFTREQWLTLPKPIHYVFLFQNTFVGRMLIGPALAMFGFIRSEIRMMINGDFKNAGLWLRHLLAVAAILYWVVVIAHMPLWLYVFGMVYPGTALLLVRSFAEHRAADHVAERTAIVENASFLGPLFLYNNLHAAHHAEPTLPWYELPAWYRRHRDRLIRENGGHLYDGYLDVIRRYFLTPHHDPLHPTDRAPLTREKHSA